MDLFFWCVRKRFIPKPATKGRTKYEQSNLKGNERPRPKNMFPCSDSHLEQVIWLGWRIRVWWPSDIFKPWIPFRTKVSMTYFVLQPKRWWYMPEYSGFFSASLQTSPFLLWKLSIKLMKKIHAVPFGAFITYQRKRQGQKNRLVLSNTHRRDPSQDC